MSALLYLLTRSAKNTLREIIRKPSRLLLYLFVLLLIAIGVLGNIFTPPPATGYKDIRFLGIAFFALLMMIMGPGLGRAFKSGGSLFQMSDVNLLFTAPIAPQKILLYGIVQFLKIAALSGAFILFQGMTLGQTFGTGPAALLLIVVIYACCFAMAETLVMLIYSVTNGQRRRQNIAKTIIALVFLPLVTLLLTGIVRGEHWKTLLLSAFDSPLLQAIPAAGWGAAAVVALARGDWWTGGWFCALIAAGLVGTLTLLMKLKADYYEDVLVATETAFEQRRAWKEGKADTVRAANRNIRVRGTGLWFRGALALFGKHVREILRGSRLGFVNMQTVLYVAGAAIFVFVKPHMSGGHIVIILPMMAWMQMFSGSIVPGWRELYTHYLYLIPESSFRRIVSINLAVVIKSVVDALLVFGVVGVMTRENPLLIIGAVAAYALFTLLLSGINIFSLRWSSADLSAGILVFLYFMAVFIVMTPGIIPALVVAAIIGGLKGNLIALIIVCLWEIIVSCFFFALSRGILNRCDMPVMKMLK